MGMKPDAIEDLECSDQRIIFKLILKEMKKYKKAAWSAHCLLIAKKDEDRLEAEKILKEAFE